MMAGENYIAKLNERAQKSRSRVTYEDVGVAGPDHIKTFTVRAVVNGKAYPEGVGKNKKEAKQNAAENALKGLLEEPGDTKENTADAAQTSAASVQTSISHTNYVSWLNEYGQKLRLTVKAVESSTLGPYNTATCSFLVGEKKYPLATGKTKREAKEEAAKLAYHEICVNKTAGTVNETAHTGASSQLEEPRGDLSEISDNIQSQRQSVETEDDGFIETNFIGIINHYCQKTNRDHQFIEEKRCGPPHRPQFFYKLVIDDKDYPVGEGKNIKEAKQNAAHLAYSALQEQSDWDSKVSFRSAMSEDGVCPSIPPLTLEDTTPKGMRTTTSTSDWIRFTNTSHPQAPIQSPDLKPKRKIAANFSNTPGKEDVKRSDLEGKPKKGSPRPSSKSKTQAVVSRFKSDFDSMERLGKGAFGRVFKAKQTLLDKFFAVKIVRCKEKALREVSALSDLHHRNIVRYYTCWMEDSEYQPDSSVDSNNSQGSDSAPQKYLYIQMELCDPKTLRLWIDERNTQNPKKSLRDFKRREDSLNIAQQLVSGVEYIHSRMLIHRDLKPANILFGQNGEVKIGDFGLVTDENDDDAENLLERTVYKGTPSYMAPEQKNKKMYDRKVDIFALGLIYFELLWNIFTSHERRAIWEDARSQKLPQGFSANFPQENRVIKMMLCLQPADRPESSKLKPELLEVARALYPQKNIKEERNTV